MSFFKKDRRIEPPLREHLAKDGPGMRDDRNRDNSRGLVLWTGLAVWLGDRTREWTDEETARTACTGSVGRHITDTLDLMGKLWQSFGPFATILRTASGQSESAQDVTALSAGGKFISASRLSSWQRALNRLRLRGTYGPRCFSFGPCTNISRRRSTFSPIAKRRSSNMAP